MPTENRSSNIEQMVSVPEGYMLVERSIWTEQQVEAATACITLLKVVPGMRDRDLAMAAIDAAQCKAPDISLPDLLTAAQPLGWVYDGGQEFTSDPDRAHDLRAEGIELTAAYGHTQHQGEPVLIQAVAVTRADDEDGLRLEWLLEGGIAEMEFPGQVLFAMAEANDLCDEDGSGYVYLQPQAIPHRGEPVARVEVGQDRDVCLTVTDSTWLRALKDRAAHQIVQLYTHPAPPVQQGEPVGALLIDEYFDSLEVGEVDVQLDPKVCERLAEKYPGQSLPLYTHPDAGELERLRAALKFYADREHYHFESGNWDTVSGEPLNILWCGDDPDFIEDGSVARAALERKS